MYSKVGFLKVMFVMVCVLKGLRSQGSVSPGCAFVRVYVCMHILCAHPRAYIVVDKEKNRKRERCMTGRKKQVLITTSPFIVYGVPIQTHICWAPST